MDRESPINHADVAHTCGKCHVRVEETYNDSVHGQLLAKGDQRGPVCTDCHTAHEVEPPQDGHFKMLSDQRCGKCHEDRLEHYRETYHGKAMALGKSNVAADVAACYDCHGYHDVLSAFESGIALVESEYRGDLPAVPSRSDGRIHGIQAAREPDGCEELSRCSTWCSWG